ncbi:hypothetical protein C1645_829705 [Glomus cerebriforme]|uniref:Uncharacterized protein n=1 Tax=Glomus cerebriforme TaxID=658196 RepID=A0A397SML6_9GLOM|nr:hypothetical protein C1645_829705 [Glomus cerebriforme]
MGVDYKRRPTRVSKLKKHLAYDCNKVDSDTKISVLMMLTNNCEDSEDDSNTTSTIRSNKEDQINKALAKMFIICNLLFALIDHPYFVKFIKTIRST